MSKSLNKMKFILFFLILLTIASCGKEEANGDIIGFTYNISNLNYGGNKNIIVYKDGDKTFIREDISTTMFHYPILKTRKAPDDFFNRLNVLLKDNKLKTKIADASEEEYGSPFYRYKFQTEDGLFIIFEGSKFPEEYVEAFHILDSFINEVVENSEIIKEEVVENIDAEDIIGFEFNFHGSDILLRKNSDENIGIVDGWTFVPSDELIDKAVGLLLKIPDMTKISMYADNDGEGDNKTNLNLFVKGGDSYKILSKYNGNKPPLEFIQKYKEIYELSSSEIGEDQ